MEENKGSITDRAVSAWLRDHMKKQGIRQRDIADELDVTMQVLRDYRAVLSGGRIMVPDK